LRQDGSLPLKLQNHAQGLSMNASLAFSQFHDKIKFIMVAAHV